MLLSVKWHKELISRIECIDQLRENYEDAQAEFEEVLQRNPLCHTKGPGDIIYQGNTGDNDTPLPVKLSERMQPSKGRYASIGASSVSMTRDGQF